MNRMEDGTRFQLEIDRLVEWSCIWQLHFKTSKCKIMQIGKNNVKEPDRMNGQVLETTRAEKDIWVMVQDNLNAL